MAGWAVLLGLAYTVERVVSMLLIPVVAPSWSATVHLFLDCGVMTGAGFAAGRLGRPRSMLAGAVLAVTLCLWNFEYALALNVPWLARLAVNSMHDSRYVDALTGSVETHVLLFGCLFAGVRLGRARERMVSIKVS